MHIALSFDAKVYKVHFNTAMEVRSPLPGRYACTRSCKFMRTHEPITLFTHMYTCVCLRLCMQIEYLALKLKFPKSLCWCQGLRELSKPLDL